MERVYSVETEDEQISLFCRFAEQYKSDFDLPELRPIQKMKMKAIFDFVIDRYTQEEGEQIFRPLFFARIGGDCDDGAIFWWALLRWAGVPPAEILVCEAREPGEKLYGHIFAGVIHNGKKIYLDNLPGCTFGKLDYPASQLRVTRMSDYL